MISENEKSLQDQIDEDKFECLAVIPARGGSKGLPRKNILPLAEKPLIAWTIEAALKSKYISRIIVSTDDKEIAEIARAFGAEVPFERPMSLSTDDIHATNVILHALDYLYQTEEYKPKYIMMLLPTCPLRTSIHINQSIELLIKSNASSIVGAYPLKHHFMQLRYYDNGELSYLSDIDQPRNAQRQNAKPIYAINGAIFATTQKNLKKYRTFHIEGAIPYIMKAEESVDIDSEEDFKKANLLLMENPR